MIELIRSEKKYEGKAFSIRQDQVRWPHGGTSKLDIVEHSGAVTILPIDSQDHVWFVRQYRHAIGDLLLELPAGTLEDGESPSSCAHREIQEEIGMAAGKLQKIGQFYLAPGYSTEFMHVYLATELYPSELPPDDDEFLKVEQIFLPEVFKMAEKMRILDAKTLASLILAVPILGISLDLSK
jgi:ADP-ribose pyrophosphatase